MSADIAILIGYVFGAYGVGIALGMLVLTFKKFLEQF